MLNAKDVKIWELLLDFRILLCDTATRICENQVNITIMKKCPGNNMKNYFDEVEEKVYRYRKSHPDRPYRAASHLMLWCFKSLFRRLRVDKTIDDIKSKSVTIYNKSILFNLNGGLGDIVIAINFLIQLHAKYGAGFTFYISVPPVFYDTAGVLIQKYDFFKMFDGVGGNGVFVAEINLCRVPQIVSVDITAIANESMPLAEWARHVYDFNKKYPEYLKSGTTGDFLLTNFTKLMGRNRLSQADIDDLVGIKTVYELPTDSDQNILNMYGLDGNKYITLQCGIGALSGDGLSTREWPVERYNELIKQIKKHNKKLMLVQIGTENDPAMAVDIDLRGKTTFNEFLVVLKNAKLHIGGESGCVHMRHFMGARPSVVLFGPTFKDFYAYDENINISSGVCPGCEWLHNGWREICIKSGCVKSACLEKITAGDVMDKIKGKL